MSFDVSLFSFIHNLAGRSTLLDFFGVIAAAYLPYAVAAAAVIVALLQRPWKIRFQCVALVMLAVVIARGIFAEIFWFILARPRPPLILGTDVLIAVPQNPSFPSGHATILFALAAALYPINRKASLWCAGGALVVSIARVFVGVHWPTDVIAGAVLGIAGAFAAKYLLERTGKEIVRG